MDYYSNAAKAATGGVSAPLIIGICAAVIVIAVIIIEGYLKAPPDVAKIISGWSKKPRILAGRAGFRVPFFERVDKIYLGQISVDIKTDTFIPTNDFINVKVDAIAKIRVRNDAEGIQLAIQNFLNEDPKAIAEDLKDSLQGNMREIIGTLDLKTINTDRDKFSDQVMSKAEKDMAKLGIEVISCNIQNVIDEHGLINDMGMDNTSKIKKDAAIAKAVSEKEIAIAQANADQEANAARVKADSEIAQKQNELEIKKANLKKTADTAKAEADAAYEIQKQEQQKTIQIATVNAAIAKAEREAELKTKEVAVREKELEAGTQKLADAEKYAAEKQSEAQLVVKQNEAAAVKAQMFSEAEGIRAKGEAEAAAIKAKGEAEAESMSKKAEAYKKYNNAAIAEMMIKVMPQMAAEISKPLSQIQGINIYGGSATDGVNQITGNTPAVIKQVFDTMKSVTSVDFSEILAAQTKDAKTDRNFTLNSKDMEKAVEKITEDKTTPAAGKKA
jgi:flotillin